MAEQPRQRPSPDAVLRQAMAPWHARSMGIAVGTVTAGGIAILTLYHGIFVPVDAPDIALLGQLFFGYAVSWQGVVVGALWGFAVGFAVGWLTVSLVNFFQATWPLAARMRHDASQSMDFLDRM